MHAVGNHLESAFGGMFQPDGRIRRHFERERDRVLDTMHHGHSAVGKCLQHCKVSSGRMAMVGYADQHPVASNATEAGRSKNRRVELLIMPTKAQAVSADWLHYERPKTHKQATSHHQDASAQTDQGPSFNK